MTTEELMNLLDMEAPEDFYCFEQLAELLECPEPIEYDDFFNVLKAIPSRDLAQLITNYFEDIQTGVSDNAIDFYTLLTSVGQSLHGLALASDEADNRRLLCDELYRFRNWYNEPSQVACVSREDGICEYQSISDALALCRAEKILNEEYDYDYNDCMNYTIDEYVMNFSLGGKEDDGDAFASDYDPMEARDMDDDYDNDSRYDYDYGYSHDHAHNHDCDCGCHDHHHDADCGCHDDDHHAYGNAFDPYRDGLIDREHPVIDGEDAFCDDTFSEDELY